MNGEKMAQKGKRKKGKKHCEGNIRSFDVRAKETRSTKHQRQSERMTSVAGSFTRTYFSFGTPKRTHASAKVAKHQRHHAATDFKRSYFCFCISATIVHRAHTRHESNGRWKKYWKWAQFLIVKVALVFPVLQRELDAVGCQCCRSETEIY